MYIMADVKCCYKIITLWAKKDVEECMDTLVNKKCEGFDRIPLCCLSDAKNILLAPFSILFNKIFIIWLEFKLN